METKKQLIDVRNVYSLFIKNGTASLHVADIDLIPRVDAAEVVRCKDCKHYRNHPNGLCYAWTEPCTNERGYKGEVHCVEPEDFCSYGERRTDV